MGEGDGIKAGRTGNDAGSERISRETSELLERFRAGFSNLDSDRFQSDPKHDAQSVNLASKSPWKTEIHREPGNKPSVKPEAANPKSNPTVDVKVTAGAGELNPSPTDSDKVAKKYQGRLGDPVVEVGLFAPRKQLLEESSALFLRLDRGNKQAITDADINAAVQEENSPRELQWIAALRENRKEIKKLDPDDDDSNVISKSDFNKLQKLLAMDWKELQNRVLLNTGERTGLSSKQESELLTSIDNYMQFFADRNHDKVSMKLWGEFTNPIEAIQPEAIMQSRIGSCFLSAALASLAKTDPAQIAGMIRSNTNGTYTVTFPGAPDEPITVKAPSKTELAIINQGSEMGVWPAVIVKAYGQYRTASFWRRSVYAVSNTGLDADGSKGGFSSDAFTLLTGRQGEMLRINSLGKENLVLKLKESFDGRSPLPVVASTISGSLGDAEKTADGFSKNHAYSVMDFKPLGPGGGTIILRDPRSVDRSELIAVSVDKFMKNFADIAYPVKDGEKTCTFSSEQYAAAIGGGLLLSSIPAARITLAIASVARLGFVGQSVVNGGLGFSGVAGAAILMGKYEDHCLSNKLNKQRKAQ